LRFLSPDSTIPVWTAARRNFFLARGSLIWDASRFIALRIFFLSLAT
jgi:hypothetical protein